MNSFDPDHALAILLQAKFNEEAKKKREKEKENVPVSANQSARKASLVDPEWEVTDPCPDIHGLFLAFNDRFFWGRLLGIEVKWSPQMTSCAGICVYEGRNGLCSVRLSAPLLKLRPRSDLVETLLHEMIHAYLFVTNNNRDRDGHGPEFHKHMTRINNEAGTNITVYHSFHAEVKMYQQHWWRCDGPCQKRPPFYGMVKRARNRAPGPNDFWWSAHQAACGGRFVKIREPEGYGDKRKSNVPKPKEGKDIRNFFKKPITVSGNYLSSPNSSSGKVGSNVFGFKNISPNHPAASVKRSSEGLNRVVGFGDLSTSGSQSGSSKQHRTFGSGHVLGGGKESNIEGKIRPSTPRPKGGILANRGGGTLVVSGTKNKSKTNETPPSPNTKLRIDSFKVFSGFGFTLGSSSGKIDRSQSRLLSLGNEPERKKPKTFVESSKSNERTRSLAALRDPFSGKEDLCSVFKCSVCNESMAREEIEVHLESCEGLRKVFNNTTVIYDDVDTDEIDNKSKITSCSVCKCSVCNKSMPREEIEVHLESCEGLKNVFNNSTVIYDDADMDEIDNKSKITSCPVCALNIEGDINCHLDECLNSSGILNVFDDSDCDEVFDEPRITLNDSNPSILILDNSPIQSPITISDTDSPLNIGKANLSKPISIDNFPSQSPIEISDTESPLNLEKANLPKPKYECDNDLEIIEPENRVACMICGMRFGESRINAHVNECLDSQDD